MSSSILNYEMPLLDGRIKNLQDYAGKVILVVNSASECGYTPQYEGLEELYRLYKDDGFIVLAFPCNQFGKQEPGSEKEIANFIECNYTVTFPIFAKLEVNGNNAHPFFKQLKKMAPGNMGSQDITWNFTKFLISRDGETVVRFASSKTPVQIADRIKEELEA